MNKEQKKINKAKNMINNEIIESKAWPKITKMKTEHFFFFTYPINIMRSPVFRILCKVSENFTVLCTAIELRADYLFDVLFLCVIFVLLFQFLLHTVYGMPPWLNTIRLGADYYFYVCVLSLLSSSYSSFVSVDSLCLPRIVYCCSISNGWIFFNFFGECVFFHCAVRWNMWPMGMSW